MNCKNCKHWKKNPPHFDDSHLGVCKSHKWNVHPNYYEESKVKTENDMCVVTYTPHTGPDFGCIHFFPTPEAIAKVAADIATKGLFGNNARIEYGVGEKPKLRIDEDTKD